MGKAARLLAGKHIKADAVDLAKIRPRGVRLDIWLKLSDAMGKPLRLTSASAIVNYREALSGDRIALENDTQATSWWTEAMRKSEHARK